MLHMPFPNHFPQCPSTQLKTVYTNLQTGLHWHVWDHTDTWPFHWWALLPFPECLSAHMNAHTHTSVAINNTHLLTVATNHIHVTPHFPEQLPYLQVVGNWELRGCRKKSINNLEYLTSCLILTTHLLTGWLKHCTFSILFIYFHCLIQILGPLLEWGMSFILFM